MYAKLKDTYGSIDTSQYGELERRKIQNTDVIFHGQVKKGSFIKHGRGCEIYKNGRIVDQYYYENKLHGPALFIHSSGNYSIRQWQNG